MNRWCSAIVTEGLAQGPFWVTASEETGNSNRSSQKQSSREYLINCVKSEGSAAKNRPTPRALNLVKNVGDLKLTRGMRTMTRKKGTVFVWFQTRKNISVVPERVTPPLWRTSGFGNVPLGENRWCDEFCSSGLCGQNTEREQQCVETAWSSVICEII